MNKNKIFYGYWIIVVAFVFVFVMAGCGVFAFSLFVRPITGDLGWGTGQVMTGFTIFSLISAIASPLIGRAIDKYGTQSIVTLGALLSMLGFVLLSRVHMLWHFYAAYATVAVGMTGFGLIPSTAAISNWFYKQRGFAMGIMISGVGIGGLVIAPFIGGYIIPNFGWRMGYLIIVGLILLVIPLALFVLRTRPSDKGLQPFGASIPTDTARLESINNTPTITMSKDILTNIAFWLIAIPFFLLNCGQLGVFQNQVPYLSDIGFTVQQAANVLSIIGIGNVVGTFFFGWLCDRIPAKYALSLGIIIQIFGVVILININEASAYVIVSIYAFLLGFGVGANAPSLSILTVQRFGLESYGLAFGMIMFSVFLGNGIGPLLVGYLFDSMNSYRIPFLICLAVNAIALVIILSFRPGKDLKSYSGPYGM